MITINWPQVVLAAVALTLIIAYYVIKFILHRRRVRRQMMMDELQRVREQYTSDEQH